MRVLRPRGAPRGAAGRLRRLAASVDLDGSIQGYSWSFGDGAGASGAQVAHAYAAPGSYSVTLTVTDDAGISSSCSKAVEVVLDPPPLCAFAYGPTGPTSLQFDAGGSTDPNGFLVQYAWEFGDGSSATSPSPVTEHTYAQPGTYDVVLTVVDDDGNESSCGQSVTTVDDQFCAFTFAPFGALGAAFDASLSFDPDEVLVEYAWDFGDGATLVGSTPVTLHAYAAPGTYTVTLTITDAGGQSSSCSQAVTVGS